MFSQAIVRRPARSMVERHHVGAQVGKPDYGKALAQHDAYIRRWRTAASSCPCWKPTRPIQVLQWC